MDTKSCEMSLPTVMRPAGEEARSAFSGYDTITRVDLFKYFNRVMRIVA